MRDEERKCTAHSSVAIVMGVTAPLLISQLDNAFGT
jgi:hypothetical protein